MSDRAGSDFEIPADPTRMPGYLAVPASGHGRGVLVLHEAWGLADDIRDVCDRLARADCVGLAPDLYRAALATTEEEALARVRELDPESVGRDLEAALAALLNHHTVDGGRVGVLGFCMGGHLALVAATRSPRVAAVVDFYGGPLPVPVDVTTLEAAVLGIFASDDGYVASEHPTALRDELAAAGKRATILVERDVGHGFMNPARPAAYRAEAAERSWDRLLAFLRAELD